jgi:serine/threonine protein kinase/Flp pilus assembly protein TadD
MDFAQGDTTHGRRKGPGSSAPGRAAAAPKSDRPALTPDELHLLLPGTGTRFLGFHIVAELGRGASGRVYLARQGDLADRLVALKVTADEFEEPDALAQLQHTNVVPIHSAHRVGPLLAVCMPYFGPTTLADVIRSLGNRSTQPATGKDLLTTLFNRRSGAETRRPADDSQDDTRPTRKSITPTLPSAPPPSALPQASAATGILRMLETLIYVDACLWIGSRLADGLAHAHDRGILHLDLKPANVLITDEGQPMLLDFNMARDTKRRAIGEAVGGTLPYMAPEHLQAFSGGEIEVDERADVFSLGVILYELLARRRPFLAVAETPTADLIALRRAGPPPLRSLNRTVNLSVEAIVHKCLHPDTARRYRSAHALAEDIRLQLANKPLKHAVEPTVGEKVRKWTLRHPGVASWTTAGMVTIVAWVGLAGGKAMQDRQATRLRAVSALTHFEDDARDVQFRLSARGGDRDEIDRGIAAGLALLTRYGVLTDAAWEQRPPVQALTPAEHDRLRQLVGDTLLQVAQGEAYRAEGAADEQLARQALDLNRRAETMYPATEVPRAVWLQRARLLAALGRPGEAASAQSAAESAPMTSARDHYLAGSDQVAAGRYREALPHLDAAVRLDPRHFWAGFLQGVCHDALGQDAAALASYQACIALHPDSPRPWLKRGLVSLRLKDAENAAADFDRVIALRPADPDAYVYRALARRGQNDARGATADLAQALDRPDRTACALRALDRAVELSPTDGPARAARAVLLARLGKRDAAQTEAREAFRQDNGPATAYWAAATFALTAKDHADDRREALRLLADALRKGYAREMVASDHDFDSLRTDPQFTAILAG